MPPAFIVPGMPLPSGGPAEMGNKAWNLMRMAAAGLPVPPGFVLPTAWCRARRDGQTDPSDLRDELAAGMKRVEAETGLVFGGRRRPLLVSVRSGAAISMPGMLETVLDVGLNHTTVEGLVRLTGNPRLAWDSYRRLVQGFAEVVGGAPAEPFEAVLRQEVEAAGVDTERELDHLALRNVTERMLELFEEHAGRPFPVDPMDQLAQAADAVFASWDAPKAASYRRLNRLDDNAGTAVTVQTMVFGNTGGRSGAGVGFTRNPATGERALYFDFCFNAQGEDVVAGRRTLTDSDRLRRTLPSPYADLLATQQQLEALFKEAQDFEFTIQDGRLFLLQTRRAQRTPLAALRIVVDMVREGLITDQEGLERLTDVDLSAASTTRFAPPLPDRLAQAIVACPGVTAGPIALDSGAAERLAGAGTPAILVRPETATSDIAGMARAAGILTAAGSRTSHAAVVARQLGKVCLIGCAGLTIDPARRTCRIGEHEFAEGDPISLDGNDGSIYAGLHPVLTERPERELAEVAAWRRETVA